jgi:hypothetical protein
MLTDKVVLILMYWTWASCLCVPTDRLTEKNYLVKRSNRSIQFKCNMKSVDRTNCHTYSAWVDCRSIPIDGQTKLLWYPKHFTLKNSFFTKKNVKLNWKLFFSFPFVPHFHDIGHLFYVTPVTNTKTNHVHVF